MPSDSASPVAITNRSSGCGLDEARLVAARKKLDAMGMTQAAWADKHGFSRRLVYKVLAGQGRCTRGTSHVIAVKLGLKDGEVVHA